MALILDALVEILKKPTIGDIVSELALFAAPLWVAAFVGLLIGWAWRPKWAADLVSAKDKDGNSAELSAGLGLRQLNFPSFDVLKAQLPGCCSSLIDISGKEDKMVVESPPEAESDKLAVTAEDLQHLWKLAEGTDGGPAWHKMMERTLPNMSYQAWRRDPENHPPQYRSRTVFEDATPEIVRDFFWDDEFRIKNGWDDMLLSHETLEECPETGTMVVHWIRKFPFFCSDREYTIGRRIWESTRSYYCVTKGVPYPSLPRRNKPRRVDVYYSSWCIRAVESRRGDGQMTACEVLLFHHEDMGIPWEIAKLGVRQGMWGCVKRIEPGLRAYQIARGSGEPPSQCVLMGQITTKFNADKLRSSEASSESSAAIVEAEKPEHWAGKVPNLLVVGGAVALFCTLDRGLLTKAVIFGVARRFANLGRRL